MTETLIEWWAVRRPHYRCPECGKISFNAHDIHARYCGRCHMFEEVRQTTREVEELRRRRHEEAHKRPQTPSDSDPVPFPLPTSFDPPAASYEAPSTALPDPPSTIDPGGGSSGGGGADSTW
jgi:ribosomal protein S27AE